MDRRCQRRYTCGGGAGGKKKGHVDYERTQCASNERCVLDAGLYKCQQGEKHHGLGNITANTRHLTLPKRWQ